MRFQPPSPDGRQAVTLLAAAGLSGRVISITCKSAVHVARVYAEYKRNFAGRHFWARGYFVSIVERDEAVIRQYIQNQQKEDERLDQLGLWR